MSFAELPKRSLDVARSPVSVLITTALKFGNV